MDILVVDDDLTTRKMLRFVLEQQGGHMIVEAEDAEAAQQAIQQQPFDLALLDVVMPGIDGLELCKRIRSTSNMPIVVVSARGDIQSRVRGLQLGADDYLPKPFDPSELLARVDAVMRRSARSARTDTDGRMRVGDVITLNLTEHQVELRDRRGSRRQVQLTPTEFKLLLVLARSPGKAFSREELQTSLWGTEIDADSAYSTVNAYVSGLRDRLESDPRRPRHVVTVRNVGYRFDP